MSGASIQLRAAALWLVHGAALARLLSAHGHERHAHNLQAALDEVAHIIAAETEPGALSDAMSAAADELWEAGAPSGSALKQ